MTNESGNWDNEFLFQNLPENIATKVIALPAPIEADGPDTIGWRGTIVRINSQLRVLTICLFRTNLLWMVIGKCFGDGGDRIIFKLSCG